ncbi:hypothetical protein [Nonomuraea sp. NPDC048916]|uniref:mechanosensitive ion channel family protein n=1 Tax=Nonomuraea sp. NPDC048916 TaxID=3154232 RepID=UPI0033D419D8
MDINIGQGLTDVWRQIATFVPRLVAFLVILVIGWFIAKVLGKLAEKILEKVGFERAVQRSGMSRALERSKYTASGLVAKVVYYAILLVTLQIAFSVFGPNPISSLLNAVVGWLPLAIVAIIIVVIAGAIASAVRDVVSGALGGLSYGRWLGAAAAVFIWALGIIAALNQIGVATTVTTPVLITVLATVGAIAAIGFGGGLVRPMQQRWERWLGTIEQQVPQAKAHAEAYQRGRQDARQMAPVSEPAGEPAAPVHGEPGGTRTEPGSTTPRTDPGSTTTRDRPDF